MSRSRSMPHLPPMLSPAQHGEPLSINNKPLCPICGERELVGLRRFCSDECAKGKKKLPVPKDFRADVWRRDRGKCSCCGMDTVALAETARVLYMQGGVHARSRATAIFGAKGFKAEDKGKSLWIPMLINKTWEMHIDNLITACRPCTRKADFNQGAYKRSRKTMKEMHGSLFSEQELHDAQTMNPEGYSSS